MNTTTLLKARTLALCLVALCAAPAPARAQANDNAGAQAQTPAAAASTPSDAVRAYYAALREGRIRDAMMMSILRPAIEGMTDAELEEFKSDFALVAAAAQAEYQLTGEQLGADEATVFVMTGGGKDVKVSPVNLILERGVWLLGDRFGYNEVKKQGKKFLFEQRINGHEQDAEDMLKRIQAVQIAYAAQHNGTFGDLNALVDAGFVPKDILGTETTGYRFTVTTGEGGRSYVARAEPERYGRTGRLSFYMDPSGLQRKDTGGKPLGPSKR
ncbi:MAG TPA: hypothetical protein VM936_01745 [Pyrinomonadaceae bacterium]|jgi:hypothetical protein|nr:hypothetical protein [Pyrinomonadaceae bacterium]